MGEINLELDNLDEIFPSDLSEDEVEEAHTLFYKTLALAAHRFYGGKMVTVPKAGIWGFNWFNVWYTPGVSAVSTTIRDHAESSFELANRGNLVGIVSDSTRVLGDGDVTPPGGLGVMEGKAFLMKYLGGLDAVALCIDSMNDRGEKDPDRIIQFVRMAQPSFGAFNLEDISQPNCFRVLDELQACEVPVWHDDAQGTGCVTLAGLLNAIEVVGKKLEDARIVFIGAGASCTTAARLVLMAGGDPSRIALFDSRGGLHRGRTDIEKDGRFYRKWELCLSTNPGRIDDPEAAVRGSDAMIALSRPGPDAIPPGWIRSMARDPIVFALANPVPEIYPHAAHEAGAAIVATGRGDFPNQVNNSLGFPGILKGALMVRARRITDSMAIEAARSIARSARSRGLSASRIVPLMDEDEVIPEEAARVAVQAVKDGVARTEIEYEQAHRIAARDIAEARRWIHVLMEGGLIRPPPVSLIREALDETVRKVRSRRS